METATIIDKVNKDVLKSFKTLHRVNNIIYTAAKDNCLAAISDRSMLIYGNPNEIDFEGTFRLTRSKLIPIEPELGIQPNSLIDPTKFSKLKTFNKSLTDLQKFCYENHLAVDMSVLIETIESLVGVYKSYTLYKKLGEREVMFEFSNKNHKTYLLAKLLD